MPSYPPPQRPPKHSLEHRRRWNANYWVPGTGPNRLASSSVGFAAGDHTWHPDFSDFFPDYGRSFLPWPVPTHTWPQFPGPEPLGPLATLARALLAIQVARLFGPLPDDPLDITQWTGNAES